MSPPNLPANAPVLNIFDPLFVNFLPMLWKEADQMFFDDRERFFRFWVTQEPLLAQPRLDRHVAAIAEADVVFVRFSLRQQSPLLQQFRRCPACLETIESV